jgi:hypothetical protein
LAKGNRVFKIIGELKTLGFLVHNVTGFLAIGEGFYFTIIVIALPEGVSLGKFLVVFENVSYGILVGQMRVRKAKNSGFLINRFAGITILLALVLKVFCFHFKYLPKSVCFFSKPFRRYPCRDSSNQ